MSIDAVASAVAERGGIVPARDIVEALLIDSDGESTGSSAGEGEALAELISLVRTHEQRTYPARVRLIRRDTDSATSSSSDNHEQEPSYWLATPQAVTVASLSSNDESNGVNVRPNGSGSAANPNGKSRSAGWEPLEALLVAAEEDSLEGQQCVDTNPLMTLLHSRTSCDNTPSQLHKLHMNLLKVAWFYERQFHPLAPKALTVRSFSLFLERPQAAPFVAKLIDHVLPHVLRPLWRQQRWTLDHGQRRDLMTQIYWLGGGGEHNHGFPPAMNSASSAHEIVSLMQSSKGICRTLLEANMDASGISNTLVRFGPSDLGLFLSGVQLGWLALQNSVSALQAEVQRFEALHQQEEGNASLSSSFQRREKRLQRAPPSAVAPQPPQEVEPTTAPTSAAAVEKSDGESNTEKKKTTGPRLVTKFEPEKGGGRDTVPSDTGVRVRVQEGARKQERKKPQRRKEQREEEEVAVEDPVSLEDLHAPREEDEEESTAKFDNISLLRKVVAVQPIQVVGPAAAAPRGRHRSIPAPNNGGRRKLLPLAKLQQQGATNDPKAGDGKGKRLPPVVIRPSPYLRHAVPSPSPSPSLTTTEEKEHPLPKRAQAASVPPARLPPLLHADSLKQQKREERMAKKKAVEESTTGLTALLRDVVSQAEANQRLAFNRHASSKTVTRVAFEKREEKRTDLQGFINAEANLPKHLAQGRRPLSLEL